MKIFFNHLLQILTLLLISLLLSSCATLAQKAANTLSAQIEAATTTQDYPEAKAVDPQLTTILTNVDLSQYQSVESPQGRPHQRPDIAIALAASGGGYRAANLTAGVLMGLEQITNSHLKGNLLEEVDYFSTVSGGGFGVGYYLASLYNFMQLHHGDPFTPQFSFTNTMNHLPSDNALDKDYRDELFLLDNHGSSIEKHLAESVLRTVNGTLRLGDIFIPKTGKPDNVRLPYWVTNTTIYQNAALLPFTPDVLKKYKVTTYPYGVQTYSANADYSEVPMAVGMVASSSFPLALTPITLGSKGCYGGQCYLQLLDGGFADNLGVNTALDLLKQDSSKIKILIVVDAYTGSDQPYSKNATPPSNSSMFWRAIGMSIDASRQRAKANLSSLAQEKLCHDGVTNVLVIYLDLSKYDAARKISTNLFITHHQQKLLLKVGQSLVKDNVQFNTLLKPLLDGNMQVGQCSIRYKMKQ